MKKIAFLVLLFNQVVIAQNNDNVLFTVDNDNVYLSEFERVYTKNNINNQADFSKASLEEYLDLFINFKLKVKEATSLQMDTIPSIKAELDSYNKQLIESYINNKEVTDELVREAYERSTKEVDVSHILVRWPNEYPSKADSASTLKKILAIRNGLNKKNFAKVAKEKSEDPSAKDNNGRLGYLTVFQTVYPFETAMYKTDEGEISDPVATRFGYHLVFVHDVRPARGKIATAHILIKSKASDSAEQKAKAAQEAERIYNELRNNTLSFEAAVKKYSEDNKTKQKGGELPLLSSAEMLTEYADAAFSIGEDGDIAAPVKTALGWHIIKRLNKEEVLSFDQSKKLIEFKVSKDSRSDVAYQKNIEDTKEKFGYSLNSKVLAETIFALKNSYANKNYTLDKLTEKELFKIGYAPFTNNDFIAYAKRKSREIKNEAALESILHQQFKTFQDDRIEKYREKNLAQINEDYKNLLQEYHDGILLFELTNNEVWNKAVEDTAGLQAYYEKNKNNYMWNSRLDYDKYTFLNEEAVSKGVKLLEKGKSFDVLNKKLNKKENQVVRKNVKVEKQSFGVKGLSWEEGSSLQTTENGKTVYYRVNRIIEPEPKKLIETRGYVISDYQNKLEKDWINSLREKYAVTVNETLFKSLIKQ